MLQVNENQISAIGRILNNQNRPLKERFRALFTLKNIGGAKAIQEINNCFNDKSVLLKHELAYCLGQMQDSRAIPILIEILEDVTQEPMVRHEAGEALGAIGDPTVIPILEEYSKDRVPEVAETCELALCRLQWLKLNSHSTNLQKSPYMSVDPAPPADITDVKKLKEILLDENVSLFERYRAMFSLRNICTPDSILALSEGLKAASALFKHEIAFVLGQLQKEIAIPHLEASLRDTNENEMNFMSDLMEALITELPYLMTEEYIATQTKYSNNVIEIMIELMDNYVERMSQILRTRNGIRKNKF